MFSDLTSYSKQKKKKPKIVFFIYYSRTAYTIRQIPTRVCKTQFRIPAGSLVGDKITYGIKFMISMIILIND